MKRIIFAFALLASVSCGSDRVRCYECDLDKNGTFEDAGCHTRSEWESITFTDNQGNGTLDKNRYCRIR